MARIKSSEGKGAFIRICAGCGEHFDKREMIRVAKCNDETKIDPSGKSSGRGVYVCRKKECIAKVKKSGRLSRSLKAFVSENIYSEMMKLVETERNDG